MTNLLQEVQKIAVKKKVPAIEAGYTVRIHQRIKEGEKQRVQIFEGLVIAINSGYGADKTITVRKVVDGVGVEKIFPIHSSNIEKIEVKKKSKVRRAKLYYMRERSGKSARLKEGFVSSKELEESVEELAAQTPAEEVAEVTTEATAQETPVEVAEAPAVEETASAEEAAPSQEEEKTA